MTDHPTIRPISGQHFVSNALPVAYRLVMKPDGNGNKVPTLQGYYASIGPSPGGEWRSLETQDWPYTDDKIPHPSLP